MALTKRIVEAQGGRVGVRSTPGQGSLFYAVLPRVAGEPQGTTDLAALAGAASMGRAKRDGRPPAGRASRRPPAVTKR